MCSSTMAPSRSRTAPTTNQMAGLTSETSFVHSIDARPEQAASINQQSRLER